MIYLKINGFKPITAYMIMSPLIIVESPAKCKYIEEWTGFDCIASYGHFRTLKSLSDIDMATYVPKYQVMSEKAGQIAKMKKAISNADYVILATDDDREGEGIAWHICDFFRLPLKTTKRIIFNEITKPAILSALKNPGVININLVEAQKSRQIHNGHGTMSMNVPA